MGRLKHLVILSLVVLVAVFVAAPSALAKKQLSEDEMDLVTAAGQPKIIQATTGTILFTDAPVNSVSLASGSQTTLTALVLNNLAGEVQVANALNIVSSVGSSGVNQQNSITQSWGATKDWTSSTVSGASATATVSLTNTQSCEKCAFIKNTQTAGSAIASASSPSNKILTKYADQIIETESGNVTVDQNLVNTLSLDTGSQTSLAALVVNNVVGLSQVANGVNIMSGNIVIGGNTTAANSGNGVQFTQQGAVTQGTVQGNTIIQYRGSPIGFASRTATQ